MQQSCFATGRCRGERALQPRDMLRVDGVEPQACERPRLVEFDEPSLFAAAFSSGPAGVSARQGFFPSSRSYMREVSWPKHATRICWPSWLSDMESPEHRECAGRDFTWLLGISKELWGTSETHWREKVEEGSWLYLFSGTQMSCQA